MELKRTTNSHNLNGFIVCFQGLGIIDAYFNFTNIPVQRQIGYWNLARSRYDKVKFLIKLIFQLNDCVLSLRGVGRS